MKKTNQGSAFRHSPLLEGTTLREIFPKLERFFLRFKRNFYRFNRFLLSEGRFSLSVSTVSVRFAKQKTHVQAFFTRLGWRKKRFSVFSVRIGGIFTGVGKFFTAVRRNFTAVGKNFSPAEKISSLRRWMRGFIDGLKTAYHEKMKETADDFFGSRKNICLSFMFFIYYIYKERERQKVYTALLHNLFKFFIKD